MMSLFSFPARSAKDFLHYDVVVQKKCGCSPFRREAPKIFENWCNSCTFGGLKLMNICQGNFTFPARSAEGFEALFNVVMKKTLGKYHERFFGNL